MNIRYKIRGTNEVGKVYVRICSSDLDISSPINLFVNKKDWDSRKGVAADENLNLNLQKLKMFILDSFNQDYSDGKIIDGFWLKNIIKNYFNRDVNEKKLSNSKARVYLSDFCDFWLETESGSWKVSAKKIMGDTLKKQYISFVETLKRYEKSSKTKMKLSEISQEDLYAFISFLEEEKYNSSTIKRNITRLKFFCNRAIEMNINVNKAFNQRIFVDNEKDTEDIYLDQNEIQSILDLDLSNDLKLGNVRDYFIIGLFTGMRMSDFLENLELSHIKGDYIEIKTQKTGQNVILPVHNEIKKVLKRNFGVLPPKVDRTTFNRDIKVICQLAEIDNVVYGSKFDVESSRKVYDYYKKYELVTSHTCRRSMATMYYGKIPNEILCSILGWSNDTMLSFYNKTSKQDYAKQFKNYVENGK